MTRNFTINTSPFLFLGVNPCNSVICEQGEECIITKFGIAECECPTLCEHVVRPVCGSNSQTYDSLCHLRKAACITKSHIQVAHNGQCGECDYIKVPNCRKFEQSAALSASVTCKCAYGQLRQCSFFKQNPNLQASCTSILTKYWQTLKINIFFSI